MRLVLFAILLAGWMDACCHLIVAEKRVLDDKYLGLRGSVVVANFVEGLLLVG